VLTAGDTETASDVKKIVEAAQVMLRGTLQKVPRIPKEVVDAINGVTFTVDGNKLIAAGKVKVDAVVHWIESENEYQKKQAEERAKASQPLPPRRPVEK
jgi:hypothetical protein